jgi:sorbitol-specific phosphotransferase system component IIC
MEIMEEGRTRTEGEATRRIESMTSRFPSALFLWGGIASIATSLGLLAAGRKQTANFVAQWVPTILLLGVYNKLVKLAGHDRRSAGLH